MDAALPQPVSRLPRGELQIRHHRVPGIKGSINGSFYGPMAAETGGNFKFQTTAGPTYLTSGIFAAKR